MTEEERKLMGSRIREKRKDAELSQDELAHLLGMKRPNVAGYEAGRVVPPGNVLKLLAEILHTTSDYILLRTSDPSPFALSAKDERDIAKDLERIMSNLENKEAMAFFGDEMELDEEGRELLKASVDQAMRLAKRMAKEKFTPKKYRRDSDKG